MDPFAVAQLLDVSTDSSVKHAGGAVSTATNAWGGNRLSLCLLQALSASLPGKRVIGLGSGLGILELVAAALGASALATDLPAVVPLLTRNVEANRALLDGVLRGAAGVRATALDWTQAPALPVDVSSTGPFDMVFASDVVYWPALFQPLVDTLVALSAWGGEEGRGPPPHVFLAMEARKPTELRFFHALDAAGFRWYRLDDSAVGMGGLGRSDGRSVGLFWARRVGDRGRGPPPPVPVARHLHDDAGGEEEEAAARVVWDYLRLGASCARADLLLVLCSNDPRVAVHAATLWLRGWAPLLLFSGGVGKLTEGLYGGLSEGEHFARIAVRMGVPSEAVLVEGRSTNTGENIRFSAERLREAGLFTSADGGKGGGCGVYVGPRRAILVQKPFMERRTLATFQAQGRGVAGGGWERCEALHVSSPPLAWEAYPTRDAPGLDRASVLSVMCGDLQRIAIYPALGYQSRQVIPAEVWAALRTLVRVGHTGHLLPSPTAEGEYAALERGAADPECVQA